MQSAGLFCLLHLAGSQHEHVCACVAEGQWVCGRTAGCRVCPTGRARSRNNSRHKLDYQQVLDNLKAKGIAIRVASPKLVMEEAPESYKVGALGAEVVRHGSGLRAKLLCCCAGMGLTLRL